MGIKRWLLGLNVFGTPRYTRLQKTFDDTDERDRIRNLRTGYNLTMMHQSMDRITRSIMGERGAGAPFNRNDVRDFCARLFRELPLPVECESWLFPCLKSEGADLRLLTMSDKQQIDLHGQTAITITTMHELLDSIAAEIDRSGEVDLSAGAMMLIADNFVGAVLIACM